MAGKERVAIIRAGLMGHGLAIAFLPNLDRSVEPTALLRKLVDNGKLGFNTSEGFKNWAEGKKAELRAKVTEHLKLLNSAFMP
jgi:3-hydroxybutyryl-CoA dehydrogenase